MSSLEIFAPAPLLSEWSVSGTLSRQGCKISTFGFMNEKCEIIIPAIFDTAKSFAKGLAEVKYQGKWGIIKHPSPAD